MKLSMRFGGVLTLVTALLLQVCDVNGKESIGDRARNIRERRHELAKARNARLDTRDDSDTQFRYLTNKTERMM